MIELDLASEKDCQDIFDEIKLEARSKSKTSVSTVKVDDTKFYALLRDKNTLPWEKPYSPPAAEPATEIVYFLLFFCPLIMISFGTLLLIKGVS